MFIADDCFQLPFFFLTILRWRRTVLCKQECLCLPHHSQGSVWIRENIAAWLTDKPRKEPIVGFLYQLILHAWGVLCVLPVYVLCSVLLYLVFVSHCRKVRRRSLH